MDSEVPSRFVPLQNVEPWTSNSRGDSQVEIPWEATPNVVDAEEECKLPQAVDAILHRAMTIFERRGYLHSRVIRDEMVLRGVLTSPKRHEGDSAVFHFEQGKADGGICRIHLCGRRADRNPDDNRVSKQPVDCDRPGRLDEDCHIGDFRSLG